MFTISSLSKYIHSMFLFRWSRILKRDIQGSCGQGKIRDVSRPPLRVWAFLLSLVGSSQHFLGWIRIQRVREMFCHSPTHGWATLESHFGGLMIPQTSLTKIRFKLEFGEFFFFSFLKRNRKGHRHLEMHFLGSGQNNFRVTNFFNLIFFTFQTFTGCVVYHLS